MLIKNYIQKFFSTRKKIVPGHKDREFVRVNDTFKVRIVSNEREGKIGDLEICKSEAINVSANGLLISTKSVIKRGSTVTIIFMKPHSFDFFKSDGKVVRTEKNDDGTYRIAINYINVSPEDMKALDYYLRLAVSTNRYG